MSNHIYKSKQIRGKGRGKLMGFPTINLTIPDGFEAEEGIYAARVWITGKKFTGALHFGPTPTFREKNVSLEIFLLDAKDEDLKLTSDTVVSFALGKRIRDILAFSSQEELSDQIRKDVAHIRSL